ncbi:MAG: hypothetical protein SFX73_18870 [Kofleriaceae bacterium]|nr:hypothetical protein [Kofleriaceae bacterium]
MQLPFNMMTPRMKLEDGEVVEASYPGLRRKGIFGNRYGELVITNQRVAFVKAIMKSGVISAAANKLGAKPMLAFPRAQLQAERVQLKKLVGVQLTSGGAVEKIVIADEAVAAVLAAVTAG